MTTQDSSQYDNLFISLAQHHLEANHGDKEPAIRGLLDSIFSFFERRTDLFHEGNDENIGFPPGVAESMVLSSFKKYQEEYRNRKAKREVVTGKTKLTACKNSSTTNKITDSVTTTKKNEAGILEAKAYKHISTWNGAVFDKYRFSQSLTELTVEITLDQNVKVRDVQVKLTDTSLKISTSQLNFNETFLFKINISESTWSLEDGCRLIFSLVKLKPNWWDCVFEGDDEKIDTSKVESTRTLDSYEAETQGQLRRIMFDQQQLQSGGATSDQITLAEKMKDAWTDENSPFKNQPFDPKLLNISGDVKYDHAKIGSSFGMDASLTEMRRSSTTSPSNSPSNKPPQPPSLKQIPTVSSTNRSSFNIFTSWLNCCGNDAALAAAARAVGLMDEDDEFVSEEELIAEERRQLTAMQNTSLQQHVENIVIQSPEMRSKFMSSPDLSSKPVERTSTLSPTNLERRMSTTGDGQLKTDRAQFVMANPGLLDDFYVVGRTLGKGAFGIVKLGTHRETGSQRAIKTISKSKLSVKHLKQLAQEIVILRCLDHPNIIKLYETFEDSRAIYLILELCRGGELFDHIVEAVHMTEKIACRIVKQISYALHYLHLNGYAHRDLKPENFLLSHEDREMEHMSLKMVDFGLAKAPPEGSGIMRTKCATAYYVAPEVLTGRYTAQCDIWSLGVITYIILSGIPPFQGGNEKEILSKVKRGQYSFTTPVWKDISNQAKSYVSHLLVLDPKQRYTAEHALHDEWIQSNASQSTNTSLTANVASNLKKFHGLNKLKKTAFTMVAGTLKDDKVEDLKQMFQDMDENGDGSLSADEIKKGFEKSGLKVPPDLQLILQEIDTDGSGEIDYTEFVAATVNHVQVMQEDMLWSAFRKFDIDGSGKLSKDELTQVLSSGSVTSFSDLGMDRAEIERILAEADTDGDGEIDFDEFLEMMRK